MKYGKQMALSLSNLGEKCVCITKRNYNFFLFFSPKSNIRLLSNTYWTINKWSLTWQSLLLFWLYQIEEMSLCASKSRLFQWNPCKYIFLHCILMQKICLWLTINLCFQITLMIAMCWNKCSCFMGWEQSCSLKLI